MTYSLVGADSHWFEVDAPSGQLKTKALLDHESPLDSNRDNRYEFRLWVTDGKDSDGNADSSVDDSIDVTVAVTNRNESPEFDAGAIELEIDENTADKHSHWQSDYGHRPRYRRADLFTGRGGLTMVRRRTHPAVS